MAPFQKELGDFRHAFEENRKQQIVNKASFDQAIKDLGARALQIGADAENLAKALKNESKTQGDWGEMVLANILSAAGLTEGRDFLPPSPPISTTWPQRTTRRGRRRRRPISPRCAGTWRNWPGRTTPSG